MAAKDRIGRAGEALRENEYIRRLIEDEELRANLIAAYGAARSAYGRAFDGKPATKAILEDRKLQRELREAARALHDASSALREPPRKARRKGGLSRALLLVVVGGVLALALSESLRAKVLDLLFGAEEEYDYSSTTMPAQEVPVAADTSAA